MSLAVVGCTVVDVIFSGVPRLPVWPRHTEFTATNLVLLSRGPIVTLGGNGANAAYVAAASGVDTVLHTRIGADVLGGLARGWLEKAGCRIVARAGGSTAINVTAANDRLERTSMFHPGEPVAMPPRAAGRAKASHLFVCGWPHPPLPVLAREFSAARQRGIFTALDAGPILGRPWSRKALRPVLAQLDLFLANEYEALRLTGAPDLATALVRLRRDCPGQVVIKRGGKGATWLPAGETQARNLPRHRVRVVNTVGAGDSFNGGLLGALARGEEFSAALQTAMRTAARVVSSPQGILGIRPVA
ncbi:MAG: carbohydrate kinase family protein [Nibricoccus sp.]